MKDRGIDHLDVDPFVSSHSVEENDNGAIDAVAQEWVSNAQHTLPPASLKPPVRQPTDRQPGAHGSRGATATRHAAAPGPAFPRTKQEGPTERRLGANRG